MIGGGAGSVELLLAMQYRLQDISPAREAEFVLVTDLQSILPSHTAAARNYIRRVLAKRGVVVHVDRPVIKVDSDSITITGGERIPAEQVIWVTNAAPARWPIVSGLATDMRGFIAVNNYLQSTSHPFVFAAGDCAAQIRHPRPKSGVFAVKQAPPLANNLRRFLRDRKLKRYIPPRDALTLIGTGDRYAVGSRGSFSVRGQWVWKWKNWIDRRWVQKYRPPRKQ